MKYKDILIFVGFVAITNYIVTKLIIDMSAPVDMLDPGFLSIVLILPILFIFNFAVRKNLNFKGYFTSKYNFLTSKYTSSISSDLPKDLMYRKMIEVLKDSPFKLVKTDDSELEILCTKGITFTSWGENIYIDFTEGEGRTQMNFVSTTVVGIVSWGKNEKNYHGLLSNYEESLTI